MSLFTLAKSAFSNFLCNVTHRFLTLQSESRHNFAYSEKFLPNTCLDLAFFRNTIKVTLSCFSRQIKFSVKTDGANSDISFLDFKYQEVECRMYFYFQLINVTTHTKKQAFHGFFLAFIYACSSFQLGINDSAAWQIHKKTRELNEGEWRRKLHYCVEPFLTLVTLLWSYDTMFMT